MGRTAGTLGPAPTAAAEELAAMISAVEESTAAREGPAVGEEGPWRTRGLKE